MLLDRIELFITVAKHQNLGKTARAIHVSASSVCQRLKSLENDFGAKLYKKKKEGIELTGAGQALVATGSEVLNRLETLKKSLGNEPQVTVRPLIVGGNHNPSAKYLPSAIAAFQKTHPDVKVTFQTFDGATVEKFLRESAIDIAIIQSPSMSADFTLERFSSDTLAFFAHPMHPLAKKKRLDLDDLARTPLIVRDARRATERMLKQLKAQGLTLDIGCDA